MARSVANLPDANAIKLLAGMEEKDAAIGDQSKG
jgi:hypothetical protein